MTPPSELDIALSRRLQAWRKKESRDEGVLWHGISHIRQGLGEKADVRAALLRLEAVGRVERSECANGIFWRAKPVDRIIIPASTYAKDAARNLPESKVRKAFEDKMWADYHSAPTFDQRPPLLQRSDNGHGYADQWVEEQYRHFAKGFRAGYAAALARQTEASGYAG